jgi:hypothetical protein
LCVLLVRLYHLSSYCAFAHPRYAVWLCEARCRNPVFSPLFSIHPCTITIFFFFAKRDQAKLACGRCPLSPAARTAGLHSFFLSINTFPTSNQLPRAQSAERPNPIILYNIYLALRASQTFAQFLPSSSPHTPRHQTRSGSLLTPLVRPPSTTSQACWKRPSCLRIGYWLGNWFYLIVCSSLFLGPALFARALCCCSWISRFPQVPSLPPYSAVARGRGIPRLGLLVSMDLAVSGYFFLVRDLGYCLCRGTWSSYFRQKQNSNLRLI